MAHHSSPAGAEEDLPGVVRQRALLMPIAAPAATPARLAAYLSLVDRPLTSLLARERLQAEAPGRWIYRSNPHRLLRWTVVPTLALAASWEDGQLRVRSTECRLAGLGRLGERLGFHLKARLEPDRDGLAGWAEVSLASPLLNAPGSRRLAGLALERVLDRIERRLGRGLSRDASAWLHGEGDKSGAGG